MEEVIDPERDPVRRWTYSVEKLGHRGSSHGTGVGHDVLSKSYLRLETSSLNLGKTRF